MILAEGWLAKLCMAHDQPGVGLVGATGTYESLSTELHNQIRPPTSRSRLRRLARRLHNRYVLFRSSRDFPPFPNPHLRTNAFVIERRRMLALKAGPFLDKEACYRFESGRRSLTRQMLARGLGVLVVGRDGRAFPIADWRDSETFRLGEQRNLLVADNQTRHYLGAEASERLRLAHFAWGE